jgi:hypothetical protein
MAGRNLEQTLAQLLNRAPGIGQSLFVRRAATLIGIDVTTEVDVDFHLFRWHWRGHRSFRLTPKLSGAVPHHCARHSCDSSGTLFAARPLKRMLDNVMLKRTMSDFMQKAI